MRYIDNLQKIKGFLLEAFITNSKTITSGASTGALPYRT